MEISVIGISHRTAPVELRECFSLPGEQARGFLRAVREEAVLDEALVLDTCNRTEVYVVSHERQEGLEHVLGPIRRLKGISPGGTGSQPVPSEALSRVENQRHPSAFYRHDGLEAVRHLFRVAASLESQIVGEHQVLGQVKEAYRLAVEERTAQFVLNRLLHAAFRAGKRVQTETQLGRGSASIAQVAVELAQVVFSSLEGKTVLFVGAGETAQLAARAVMRGGAKRLIVANRTLERAREAAAGLARAQAGGASCQDVREAGEDPFAEAPIRCPALLRMCPDLAAQARAHSQGAPPSPPVETRAITLEEIPGAIGGVDLVISATAAPQPVLTREKLAGALGRLRRPLVIIDLAVPRDVDQRLGKLPNVYLHDIDDLNRLVERNLQRRLQEVPQAEAIITDEVERFGQWLEGLQLTPMIKLLQKHLEALQQAEISRYGHQFAADDEQLRRFTQSLCQKILHKPLTFLREVSKSGRDGESLQALDFVRRMFDLDSVEEGT